MPHGSIPRLKDATNESDFSRLANGWIFILRSILYALCMHLTAALPRGLFSTLCLFFLLWWVFSLTRIRKEKPRKMLAIWFSLVSYFINHLQYIYVDTYTDVAPQNTTTLTTIQSESVREYRQNGCLDVCSIFVLKLHEVFRSGESLLLLLW